MRLSAVLRTEAEHDDLAFSEVNLYLTEKIKDRMERDKRDRKNGNNHKDEQEKS